VDEQTNVPAQIQHRFRQQFQPELIVQLEHPRFQLASGRKLLLADASAIPPKTKVLAAYVVQAGTVSGEKKTVVNDVDNWS
jgi:hypothetical protein